MKHKKQLIRKAINKLFAIRESKKRCKGQIRDAEKELIDVISFEEWEFKELKNNSKN